MLCVPEGFLETSVASMILLATRHAFTAEHLKWTLYRVEAASRSQPMYSSSSTILPGDPIGQDSQATTWGHMRKM